MPIYWTKPGSLVPWLTRYRHRLDGEYIIQAAGFPWAGHWTATLLIEKNERLIPVLRRKYKITHGMTANAKQAFALNAICGAAAKSKHAANASDAVKAALAAMQAA